MKNIQRISVSVLLLTFIIQVKSLNAQDPTFSQSFSSALYLNPALTGFSGFTRIQASQRIQWPSIPGNFYTTYLGADFSSKSDQFGFGVATSYDVAGTAPLTTLSQNFNFSYRLKFTEYSALRFGLGLGWSSRTIHWENLTFGDEIDPRYGFISTSGQPAATSSTVTFTKLNLGAFFNNKYLYAGYSVFNMNEPKQGFSFNPNSKLPMRHSLQLGAKVYQSENEKFRINLAGVFYKQQDFETLLVGFNSMYKRIGFGLMYRNKDAYIAGLSYNMKRFQVKYSYDVTISRLTNQTGGAHEFSIGLLLGKGRDARVNGTWVQNQF